MSHQNPTSFKPESLKAPCISMIFAKLPVPGSCKTRLGETIGMGPACELAEAFLRDSLDRFYPTCHQLILLGDKEEAQFMNFSSENWPFYPQGGGDLGARQARCFEHFLQSAVDQSLTGVLALGADTPHLPTSLFQASCEIMSKGKAAVGPATDGGYYLLGLPTHWSTNLGRTNLAEIFRLENWGGESILSQLLQKLNQAQLDYELLEDFDDIDLFEDLESLKSALPKLERPARRSADCLAKHKLI